MESREEIESMRVIDLREFLRRHGYQMKHVTRPNGTPGPMRKSELLQAALEIYDEHQKGNPSPSHRAAALKPSPSNPFQSGLPTPPDKKRHRQSSSSASIDHPKQSPAEQEAPPKSRRRSSAWVDPVLLAQMRATTPTKPKDTSSRARLIAPRPLFGTPQQPPSRLIPEPSPIRPPQRIVRQPSSEKKPSRPAQRAPTRVAPPSRKPATSSRASLTPRRLALRKPEPELEPPVRDSGDLSGMDIKQAMDIRQAMDTPPPPAPTRRLADPSVASASERKRLALDIDEDYISEEDPDYDADAEEADIDYLGKAVTDDEEEEEEDDGYVVVENLSLPAVEYDGLRYDTVPPLPQEPIDVDMDIQEDIPVDSDHYQREIAGESDAGSTIETDDDQGRGFGDWSTADVRTWLREHSVRFRQTAHREELISVARAHALHMEATASIQRQDFDHRPINQERDVIASNQRNSDHVRRRRTITAPTPDDESIPVEVEPASVCDERRKPKPSKNEFASDPITARFELSRRRPLFVLFPLIVLTIFLCSSGFVALAVLQKHLTMTYCNTNATSTLLDSGVECRPCPRHGHCVDGMLQCDPGYVELRGRCLEDKEFNLFSERLAYSAFELMSKLAGRSECGEDVPRAVSPRELADAMLTFHTRRKQTFDRQKFEDAMEKAIVTLQTDEAFDVTVHENGYLSSNEPRFSFTCRVKRKLWEHKRALSVAALLFLSIIYMKVKRYMQMIKERRLDEAHANALEYLRDQVNAFRNNEEDVAFVPDVVLREEVVGRPTPENKKFWKDVEERLNRDARVMRKHQVLKGMPSYTFEYVGSRRASSRRSSGSFFETSSRRGSFGSRASLDSFDFVPGGTGNEAQQGSLFGFFVRLFTQQTD